MFVEESERCKDIVDYYRRDQLSLFPAYDLVDNSQQSLTPVDDPHDAVSMSCGFLHEQRNLRVDRRF